MAWVDLRLLYPIKEIVFSGSDLLPGIRSPVLWVLWEGASRMHRKLVGGVHTLGVMMTTTGQTGPEMVMPTLAFLRPQPWVVETTSPSSRLPSCLL